MDTLITNVGSLVTAMVSYVGQWVGAIVAAPLLLAFAVVPLIGLAIGLLRRLININ